MKSRQPVNLVKRLHHCLPKGRLSEAAHEKRLLCAQKCTRGGVGWGVSCRGEVGHVGVR